MRIYLAGPMKNYNNFNFPAFHEAAAKLRKLGHHVINPAEHDEEMGFDPTLNSLDGFDLYASMRWDLGQVLLAEMVCVLPHWEQSKGAKLEVMVAKATGVPVAEVASFIQSGITPSHIKAVQ